MYTNKQKINFDHLQGEIKSIENGGYKECKRSEACRKVVFIDELTRRQKTVYFKSYIY